MTWAHAWKKNPSRMLRRSRRAIRRAQKKSWSLPRSEKQLKNILDIQKEGSRIASSLPRSRKQLRHSKRVIRKAIRQSSKDRKTNNGVCRICKKECFTYKDHCHKTGRKRGKLCMNCNGNLGWFEKYSRRIKRYLRRYE